MKTEKNPLVLSSEISTIAREGGIFLGGTLLGTGLRFSFDILAARHLGAEKFGLFFLGIAILKIAEIVSTLGLHRGALRYVAIFNGEKDIFRIKGTILYSLKMTAIFSLFISTGIITFSHSLATNIFHKPALGNILIAFSLSIPFTCITTIFVFSTQGFKTMMPRVTVREIFEPLIRLSGIIIVVILGGGLKSAVLIYFSSLFLGCLLAFSLLKKLFPSLTSFQVKPQVQKKEIFQYSWPLLFAEFFSLIIIWINILFLGIFSTSSNVGIYSSAHRTALLIQIVLISFNAIFSPIIADLWHKKEIYRLSELFRVVTKWSLLLSLPISLFMILSARNILVLFGKDYVQGANCLTALALAQLISSFLGTSGFMIMMSGKSKINLLNNLAMVILLIIFNILLIPSLGIMGPALSFLFAVALINLITIIEVYIIFRIHPFRLDLSKPIIAGIFSSTTLWLFQEKVINSNSPLFTLFLSGVLFIITYFSLIIILGIEEEEKIILSKLKEKLQNFNEKKEYK